MWMLDTPDPFAPRSEMLAFLKECEPDKDDPGIQRAMKRVQGYLDKADQNAAASAKKSAA